MQHSYVKCLQWKQPSPPISVFAQKWNLGPGTSDHLLKSLSQDGDSFMQMTQTQTGSMQAGRSSLEPRRRQALFEPVSKHVIATHDCMGKFISVILPIPLLTKPLYTAPVRYQRHLLHHLMSSLSEISHRHSSTVLLNESRRTHVIHAF